MRTKKVKRMSNYSGTLDEVEDYPIAILDSADFRLISNLCDKPVAFLVSSYALVFASPVWKNFVRPPFHRLASGEEDVVAPQNKQIDFSEDNGEALLLLLHIAHLQFNKLPSQLPFNILVAVAVLCDKYDCAGLVKPWLPLWLVNEESQSMEPDHEEWLFIAWVFGREKTFRELAAKLVTEVKISEEGDCLTPTGKMMPDLMPPDIISKPNLMNTFKNLETSIDKFYFYRKNIESSSRYHQSFTESAIRSCRSLR